MARNEPTPAPPDLLVPKKEHPYIEKFEYTKRGNEGRFEIVNRPLPPDIAAICCASNIRNLYQLSQEAQIERGKKDIEPSHTIRDLIKRGPKIGRVRFHPVGEVERQAGTNRKHKEIDATIYSQHINTSQHIPAKDYGIFVFPSAIEEYANLATLRGYNTEKTRCFRLSQAETY